MNASELADELESLLPDLRHSRATHIQWRDCDQSWRDANPHIGSKEFHADAVADYDRRIEVINKAVKELRAALPEQPQEPVAFQFGDNFEYVANFWPPENVGDTPIRPLYADLDHYQDEGREILNDQPADCLFE